MVAALEEAAPRRLQGHLRGNSVTGARVHPGLRHQEWSNRLSVFLCFLPAAQHWAQPNWNELRILKNASSNMAGVTETFLVAVTAGHLGGCWSQTLINRKLPSVHLLAM